MIGATAALVPYRLLRRSSLPSHAIVLSIAILVDCFVIRSGPLLGVLHRNEIC